MKKRVLSLLLAVVMLFTMCPVTVSAEDVTEISDQAGLAAMKDSAASYKLTSDITLDDAWVEFTPKAGTTLDGNGYTITLSGKRLFDSLNSTDVIKNLILTGNVKEENRRNTGALAGGSSATIRNCITSATVSFTNSGATTFYVGGFVGKINGGTISNCVSTAVINQGDSVVYGGIGSFEQFFGDPTGKIENCYVSNCKRVASVFDFMTDTSVAADLTGKTYSENNTILDGTNDLGAVASALNDNRAFGDLEWEVKDGALTLKRAVVTGEGATEEQLAALSRAIETAEDVDTDTLYTANSWSSFEKALENAKSKADESKLTAASVTAATTALTDATSGLEQRNVDAADLSGQEVISIKTADELEKMQAGKYYRLDADITLGQYWFGYSNTMNSVLDGNGHTVTLIGKPLWSAIGPDGIIQNLGIMGNAQNLNDDTGAMAKDCSGLIVNCWSQVNVTAAGTKTGGGLVANLKSGGAIVNSYVIGSVSAAGTAGTLAGTAESNTLVQNCYWLNSVGVSAVGSGSGITSGNTAKAEKEIKSEEFIDLLNENRGRYGKKWTQADSGYPHLGEAGNYVPAQALEITFTNHKGEKTVFSSDEGLRISLSAQNVTTDRGYAGTLSAEGVTSWQNLNLDGTGQNNILYLYDQDDDGCAEVYLNKVGSVTVQTNGANQTRFTIQVTPAPRVHDVRLKAGEQTFGTAGTNELTVQGSKYIDFATEVQYEADGAWEEIPAELVKFTAKDDTGRAYLTGNTFHATAPGAMSVTATYESIYSEEDTSKIDTKTVTVNITSAYVPVTSITPDAHGTYVVHERNANSDSSGEFLDLKLGHSTGSVTVKPDNASYQGWTLTSSDPSVAEYVDAFLKAVLPRKAGTTTLTAVSDDPNANVSGTSEITIVYKNPVTAVTFTGENNTMTVEANKSASLPLTFTGSKGMDAYHVTEPGMNWTYNSTDGGAVRIVRDGSLGVIIGAESSTEYCVANDKYKIYGEAAGTVVVTGTPVDTTGGAQPITFTVTVTAGEGEVDADEAQLVKKGIDGAVKYLQERGAGNYVFGNEWEVFSLTRAGAAIDSAKKSAYLESVKAAYTAPVDKDNLKPTTIARVVLTLGVLGEDATDFNGVDFIKMLYTSDLISAGSNEAMWALIALDSLDYQVPTDAKWTRDKLIAELSKYLCSDGGVGLSDNTASDSDLTAMMITALAPYYSRENVKTIVDEALAYLKSDAIMDRDCVITGNVEATAQTLIGISTMELDAAKLDTGFAKSVARNLITALVRFQVDDGGFKHLPGDTRAQVMSSAQALQAFVAYDRFQSGKTSLYDMSDLIGLYDITVVEPAHGAIEVAASAKAGDTVTVTLKPDIGYAADKLYIGGTLTAVTDNKATFTMPESDVVISASFKLSENADRELTEAMATLTNNDVKDADENAYELLAELTDAFDALSAAQQEALKATDAYKNFQEKLEKFEDALDELKKDAEDDLDDSFEELDEKDYTKKNWKKIEEIYDDAIEALGDVRYAEEIERIVEDAIDAMEDIAHGGELEVTFRLIGDFKHEDGVSGHGGYVTWIETTDYTLEAGSTMYDLFMMAIEDAGLSQKGAKNNYVESIKAPGCLGGYWLGEFDNGRNSGWMYTVDGDHPGTGLKYHDLKDGDEVIWHYVDDYTKEERNSSGKYYERWLEARDISPEKYVERTIGDIVSVGRHGAVKPKLGIRDIGKDITFRFQPDNGYVVNDVIIDGKSVGAVESYTYKDLAVSSRIEVTFVPAEVSVQSTFSDVVPGAWYSGTVAYVTANGFFSGTGNGNFSPNTTMSRAMMVTVLHNMAKNPASYNANLFGDVASGAWYDGAVRWATANGIASGYPGGRFGTNDDVTREQIAVFLYNYAKATGYDVSSYVSLTSYADDETVSAYARTAMEWAVAEGIISGRTGNLLAAKSNASRAEVATMICNFAQNIAK